MYSRNLIFLDFSLDHKYIFILNKNKFYKKKLIALNKSENVANIFLAFVKKNKIKINNTFYIFINLGPGNLIAIRNSFVLAKILSLIFNCKLQGFSNYQLLKLKKEKAKKVLLTIGKKKLLLDLSKKSAKKLLPIEEQKFHKFRSKIIYNREILHKLALSKKYSKKVFPISYSNV